MYHGKKTTSEMKHRFLAHWQSRREGRHEGHCALPEGDLSKMLRIMAPTKGRAERAGGGGEKKREKPAEEERNRRESKGGRRRR